MHSYGSKLEVSDDDTFSVVTEIEKVRSIEGGDDKATMSPSHHLRSQDAVKTKDIGMIEEGARNYQVVFSATAYALLRSIFKAREKKFWRETLSDGSTLTGEAGISGLGKPTAPDDDEIMHTIELTPTGGWDFTAA